MKKQMLSFLWLLCSLLLLLVSCNNIQQNKNKDECLSRSTLYLYSALNDDYIPVFNTWNSSLNLTDSEFTKDAINIINLIKPLIDSLLIQSGGVHPTDYVLIDPCKKGGDVVVRIFDQNLRRELSNETEYLKQKYGSINKYQLIINLFDHVLMTHFYGDNPFFNPDHVINTSYSILGLELLLLEHTLYLFIHKNLI
jgi:hypothetical protein